MNFWGTVIQRKICIIAMGKLPFHHEEGQTLGRVFFPHTVVPGTTVGIS